MIFASPLACAALYLSVKCARIYYRNRTTVALLATISSFFACVSMTVTIGSYAQFDNTYWEAGVSNVFVVAGLALNDYVVANRMHTIKTKSSKYFLWTYCVLAVLKFIVGFLMATSLLVFRTQLMEGMMSGFSFTQEQVMLFSVILICTEVTSSAVQLGFWLLLLRMASANAKVVGNATYQHMRRIFSDTLLVFSAITMLLWGIGGCLSFISKVGSDFLATPADFFCMCPSALIVMQTQQRNDRMSKKMESDYSESVAVSVLTETRRKSSVGKPNTTISA